MRRPVDFLLLCWVSLTFGLGSAAYSEEDLEPIGKMNLALALYDSHPLFLYDRDVAVREVESIFDAFNVGLHWRRNDDPAEDLYTGPVLHVVFMTSDPSGPGWRLNEDTLGVSLSGKGWKRSVFIFFPNVARAVGIRTSADPALSPGQRRDLSRALGRVMAHEMVHAVSPSHPHSDQGLMCSNLSASFLSKRKVSLDGASRAAFLTGLRDWVALPSHAPVSRFAPRLKSSASSRN